MKRKVFLLAAMFCLIGSLKAEASIVITEILADPASGLMGDANSDGVRHSFHDEFVEIFNDSGSEVNLSGWSLHDAGAIRHLFPIGSTIESFGYFVVFGGGAPNLPDVNWQKASSGGLSLNNSADTIRLFDDLNAQVDEVIYDSIASENQSIVRMDHQWVLHTQINDALQFSPGAPSLENSKNVSAVPEPTSLALMSLGAMFMYKRRL